VAFNPDLEWTVDPHAFKSRAKNTPYGGWKLRGKVLHTVFKGRLVVRDGELAGSPAGKPVGRQRSADYDLEQSAKAEARAATLKTGD
jgi:hypothetical protein